MNLRKIFRKLPYSLYCLLFYLQNTDLVSALILFRLFWESTLARSEAKRLVSISLNGYPHSFWLRSHTSDILVFNQIIMKKEYATEYPFDTPANILDLGANIGLTSVYFTNIFPDAKIVAIEPDEGNFQMLLKNTALYPNITAEKSAVWGKKTLLEIEQVPGKEWGTRVKEVKKKSKDSFMAKDISTIMKEYSLTSLDILKIDIEGSEIELFRPSRIPWIKKTKMIFVELHERYAPGCTTVVMNQAKKHNFSVSYENEHCIFIAQ